MTYDELTTLFSQLNPNAKHMQDGSADASQFNGFVQGLMQSTGANDWTSIPADQANQYTNLVKEYNAVSQNSSPYTADWNQGFQAALANTAKASGAQDWKTIQGGALTKYIGANPQTTSANGTTAPSTTTSTVPLEQGLLNTYTNNYLAPDINNDANRQTLAATLGTQAVNAAQTQSGLLNTLVGGGQFDGQAYLNANPDVKAQYDAAKAADPTIDLNTWAQNQYNTVGKAAGLQPVYTQDQRLSQEQQQSGITSGQIQKNATEAANSQLGSLQQMVSSLQGNLSGDLAARADALQKSIAALNANLGTYDQSQRANLAAQIQSQTQDLQTSIDSQRTALSTQIQQLGSAADAQSQAKLASLQTELTQLNAAQKPLNDARTAGAQALVTAVNLGLESTKDQLSAQQAQQGFIGGSTASDSNLARATVQARQQAAQAVAGANTANATDTRDIGFTGATGQRTIADALADAKTGIAVQNANDTRSLSNALAVGNQQIGDYSAAQTRGIGDTTALGYKGIADSNATQTQANSVWGADQSRAINDQGAQGTFGIRSGLASAILQAKNTQAAQNQDYFNADLGRSLSASAAIHQIGQNLTSALTGYDNYGQSGLNRGLNTLNWWTSSATPPTPGVTATNPSTTGNAISQLGAGLTGAALNYANSQNWGQKPSTGSTPPGVTNPTTQFNYSLNPVVPSTGGLSTIGAPTG